MMKSLCVYVIATCWLFVIRWWLRINLKDDRFVIQRLDVSSIINYSLMHVLLCLLTLLHPCSSSNLSLPAFQERCKP